MNLKHTVRSAPRRLKSAARYETARIVLAGGLRMRFFLMLLTAAALAGCDAGAPAGDLALPADARLPRCSGFDDAAVREVFDEIDAAWAQGLNRAEVLAVGFASGCREQCFTCWEDITDFVFFELH